jgi:hypothetical protein
MVGRVLQKKTQAGQARFPEINGAIYVAMRPFLDGVQPVWQAGFVNTSDSKLISFVDDLRQQWFAFVARGHAVAAVASGKGRSGV